MTSEAARVAAATCRAFARRAIAPFVAANVPDGDRARLPDLMQQADDAGLLSADVDSALWADEGLACASLEELAIGCAGVATCIHAAALGAIARASWGGGARTAVALLEQPLTIGETLACGDDNLSVRAQVETRGGEARLFGHKRFCYAAPRTDMLVIFAREDDGWRRALVRLDDAALTLRPHGARSGLSACAVFDVELGGARAEALETIARSELSTHLRRLWLGLAAIAVGNARAALSFAAAYAGERYQGGRLTDEHDAVRRLLGRAEARLELARGALAAATSSDAASDARARLRAGALLKAAVTRDCAEAVSDCLQVLGGYGYMQDYGLEKRLRDALTLRAMAGTVDELLLYVGATCAVGTP